MEQQEGMAAAVGNSMHPCIAGTDAALCLKCKVGDTLGKECLNAIGYRIDDCDRLGMSNLPEKSINEVPI